ncbi:MAG: ribonuclease III, partial [Lentisphaerae bacterium]|nr:ribonuclease III [Lentisphaerota bacterium]
MRLFFHNPYRALEKKLGYSFRDKELLAMALMHPSFRFETAAPSDNQRIEFLGDSALSLVSGDYLYARFPELDEGGLTRLRSQMTCGKTLADIGMAIGLGDELKLGKGEKQTGGHRRPSTIGDALEAVIGAAYLDSGLKAVNKIFQKLFVPCIELSPTDEWSDNPKGHLQKIAQRRWKRNPHYRVVRHEGPQHAKTYFVEVNVADIIAGAGQGLNKRDAECRAAQDVLDKLAHKD